MIEQINKQPGSLSNEVHILNGDALQQRFPRAILGEQIVARECLVDGDVTGETFAELMATRAAFIDTYPQCSSQAYLQSTMPEFEKIIALTDEHHANCWFEDDLFCQVNFWYVCYLLAEAPKRANVWLVRPSPGNEYSFAHMSDLEILEAYTNKVLLQDSQLEQFAQLWLAYQQQNWLKLENLAHALAGAFSFIVPAVNAQLARLPNSQGLGEPEIELLAIMRNQQPLSFDSAFRVFYQKMAIYSFGDLQVKAMYDRLLPLV